MVHSPEIHVEASERPVSYAACEDWPNIRQPISGPDMRTRVQKPSGNQSPPSMLFSELRGFFAAREVLRRTNIHGVSKSHEQTRYGNTQGVDETFTRSDNKQGAPIYRRCRGSNIVKYHQYGGRLACMGLHGSAWVCMGPIRLSR